MVLECGPDEVERLVRREDEVDPAEGGEGTPLDEVGRDDDGRQRHEAREARQHRPGPVRHVEAERGADERPEPDGDERDQRTHGRGELVPDQRTERCRREADADALPDREVFGAGARSGRHAREGAVREGDGGGGGFDGRQRPVVGLRSRARVADERVAAGTQLPAAHDAARRPVLHDRNLPPVGPCPHRAGTHAGGSARRRRSGEDGGDRVDATEERLAVRAVDAVVVGHHEHVAVAGGGEALDLLEDETAGRSEVADQVPPFDLREDGDR